MNNNKNASQSEVEGMKKQLAAELAMYNKTLRDLDDTSKHKSPKPDAKEKIMQARSETIERMRSIGMNPDDVMQEQPVEAKPLNLTLMPRINPMDYDKPIDMSVEDVTIPNFKEESDYEPQCDVISIPSKGEPYKSKKDSLLVAYMTANDENLITSPNLYKDGLLIDYLIKNKVKNKDFDPEDLCTGDADALTLWLRATAYGNEFPVSITDPETNETFDYTIDLSQIKEKPFNLKGDENGWFDFKCGVSGDQLKFRFLTRRDERKLRKMDAYENESTKKIVILTDLNEIASLLQDDSTIDGMNDTDRKEIVNKLTDWAGKASENINAGYTKMITNRMEMQIMSVNGNTDRNFIHKYVGNMPTRDALEFRRYVLNNEPGMDFEVEVERPESLGGGSFKTFLPWDDTIFYHIA